MLWRCARNIRKQLCPNPHIKLILTLYSIKLILTISDREMSKKDWTSFRIGILEGHAVILPGKREVSWRVIFGENEICKFRFILCLGFQGKMYSS